MPAVNRTYKDRLFCFIFGSEEHKAWTLSLYNAVNGSSYTDPEMISINTIREVLYLSMRNDVSFLIGNEMNLYEQQSSYNPNMPLRFLQYLGNLYEKYVTEQGVNKFGSGRIALPTPRLVVFYNGETETKEEAILKLSDSFPKDLKSDVEVSVRMLNINAGKNEELLKSCKALQEYMWLVERIRTSRRELDLEDAVEKAITEMPEEFVLKTFLLTHRAEVKGMLLTEYNEAEAMKLFERDGEKRLAALMEKLFALGRIDDARKAASDPVFRNRLLKEMNIQ